MDTYRINKNKYYKGDELRLEYPEVFKGCHNCREFIKKKDIIEAIFAREHNDKWKKSSGVSNKFDKVFIDKEWFDAEYANIINKQKGERKIQDAPKIIKLTEEEKFVDNNNNVIEIEVRGERDVDKCYFKVKDIMEGFGIEQLDGNIVASKSRYEYDVHYKYFYLTFVKNSRKRKIKKLYLTYNGLLRVLFASHKKTTDKFVNWASKTLFTAHLGTNAQKEEFVGSLLGVSIEAVKQVFNKSAQKIPCNYLLILGKVKDLRKVLKIDETYDDESYVSKWGMTCDLTRRLGEHENDFGKMKGAKLELYAYGYIDPQYISEAETQLKKYMDGMDLILEHKKYQELAIIPKNKLTKVKNQITLISKTYMGHIAELINKIKEKDNEIENIKLKNELENNKLKHELELMKKDLEIEKLKMKCSNKSKIN